MFWLKLVPIAGTLIKELATSGNKKDIHTANVIQRQRAVIERIISMQHFVNNGIAELDPNVKNLFMVITSEIVRDAQETMRSAATLSEKDINIDPLMDEIEKVVEEKFGDKESTPVV